MCVLQVGGGHSVQRQVGAGEPSRQRRLQADGRGGHEHPGEPEQGRLEVHTQITDQLINRALCQHDGSVIIFDCVCGYWQGAEVSGDRDGDVHGHVLSLPADQDHEERLDTDTRVSAAPVEK